MTIDGSTPAGIAKLPIYRGHHVPWFVEWFDGKPDFRIADHRKLHDAHRFSLCWMCGERRGRYGAFVIGPMCAVNRVSAEPPSHKACAVYAAKACPFLSAPKMRRREDGMPDEEKRHVAGIMIERNPGVALVWVSKAYSTFRAPNGVLFDIGDPVETLWYARGRQATRAEVLASMESGLPLLQEAAAVDGAAAVLQLQRQYKAALTLVPTVA